MQPRNVLLAEDDADDKDLFLEFLQHRTDIYLLPVAENGVMLWEWLQQIESETELPHLIILDQNMPKRNGLQTLQLLKESVRYAHIPVMIYSTYTDHHLIKTATEKGASMVAQKPISKESYNKMIDAFLEVGKP